MSEDKSEYFKASWILLGHRFYTLQFIYVNFSFFIK